MVLSLIWTHLHVATNISKFLEVFQFSAEFMCEIWLVFFFSGEPVLLAERTGHRLLFLAGMFYFEKAARGSPEPGRPDWVVLFCWCAHRRPRWFWSPCLSWTHLSSPCCWEPSPKPSKTAPPSCSTATWRTPATPAATWWAYSPASAPPSRTSQPPGRAAPNAASFCSRALPATPSAGHHLATPPVGPAPSPRLQTVPMGGFHPGTKTRTRLWSDWFNQEVLIWTNN